MSVDTFPAAIAATLLPLADVSRAAAMRAYMRGQFEFIGIPTPLRRVATAALIRQPQAPAVLLASAEALWTMAPREFQYVAVDLLARHWRALGLAQVDDLLALARRRSWWDTVDALAGVVGDIVRAASKAGQPAQQRMDTALRDENLWIRRIAMLHQLGWRADTDVTRLFAYALQLAPEEDFFIRKAIGWALRDYARHDPAAVREFLVHSGRQLSALSIREAAKHLPPL